MPPKGAAAQQADDPAAAAVTSLLSHVKAAAALPLASFRTPYEFDNNEAANLERLLEVRSLLKAMAATPRGEGSAPFARLVADADAAEHLWRQKRIDFDAARQSATDAKVKQQEQGLKQLQAADEEEEAEEAAEAQRRGANAGGKAAAGKSQARKKAPKPKRVDPHDDDDVGMGGRGTSLAAMLGPGDEEDDKGRTVRPSGGKAIGGGVSAAAPKGVIKKGGIPATASPAPAEGPIWRPLGTPEVVAKLNAADLLQCLATGHVSSLSAALLDILAVPETGLVAVHLPPRDAEPSCSGTHNPPPGPSSAGAPAAQRRKVIALCYRPVFGALLHGGLFQLCAARPLTAELATSSAGTADMTTPSSKRDAALLAVAHAICKRCSVSAFDAFAGPKPLASLADALALLPASSPEHAALKVKVGKLERAQKHELNKKKKDAKTVSDAVAKESPGSHLSVPAGGAATPSSSTASSATVSVPTSAQASDSDDLSDAEEGGTHISEHHDDREKQQKVGLGHDAHARTQPARAVLVETKVNENEPESSPSLEEDSVGMLRRISEDALSELGSAGLTDGPIFAAGTSSASLNAARGISQTADQAVFALAVVNHPGPTDLNATTDSDRGNGEGDDERDEVDRSFREATVAQCDVLYRFPTHHSIFHLMRSLAQAPICILLCHGGYFAGAIYVAGCAILHKCIHRYVVRRGQGGKQSNQEGIASSAGSQIRRGQEIKFRADVREVLDAWRNVIAKCWLIAHAAPSPDNKRILADWSDAPRESRFATLISPVIIPHITPAVAKAHNQHASSGSGGKGGPAQLPHDPRVFSIPFSTHRPVFGEVERVFGELTTLKRQTQDWQLGGI